MNLDQLCLSVSSKTGMDNTAASAERLLMEAWANAGVVEVLITTGVHVAEYELPIVADQFEYDITGLWLRLIGYRNPIDSNRSGLAIDSMNDLLVRQFSAVDGTVARFSVQGNLLLVEPTPTDASTLTLWVVPVPTSMTLGTHDPSSATYGGVPAEYHRAIELWMLTQGMERVRDFNARQAYQALFDQEIGKIQVRKRGKAGRLLPPGRIGYPDRYRPSHLNDTYPS